MNISTKKIKLARITTVSISLKYLLPGQMKFMREQGIEVIMMSAPGPEIPSVIEQEGCIFHALPFTRTISPLKDLKCIWHLYKWLKNEKPSIIHSETPKAGLVAMISGWLAGVPVRIHTVAGLPLMVEKGFKYWMLVIVERVTNALATQVWPNSFSLKKIMLEKKLVNPNKVIVLANGSSNGTDTFRYSEASINKQKLELIKQEIGFEENLSYNLCVARLVQDKGIAELVEAFAVIYESFSHQRLLLVGPYEKHLDPLPESTISVINSHPGILRIPMTDAVEYYMYISQLFVFPSYREGFPNVLMEAGSMGLPVICSKIEGNVDMVTDGKTGLLFEKQDAADLLKKWLFALENRSALEKMGLALQQLIRQNFDRSIVWKAMHTQYLNLVSKKAIG